jgi:hypothetical protein
MSVEDRLRAGLEADANTLDLAVEVELGRVIERTARRRRRRWGIRVAGIAAVAASVATVTVLDLDQDRDTASDPVVQPPESGVAALAGEYAVDVPESAAADALDLAGRWTVTIDLKGRIEFSPPPRLRAGVSGAALRLDGDLAETNALHGLPGCQTGTGTGLYRWDLDQDSLTFAAVGEDCQGRTILFGEATWRRLP